MFAGYGDIDRKYSYFNDMWVYRVNNETWTWVAGSNTANHLGASGEKGVASADYIPASRAHHFVWYDNSTREVWMFGGYSARGT